jgi:subtilisin family serine protease
MARLSRAFPSRAASRRTRLGRSALGAVATGAVAIAACAPAAAPAPAPAAPPPQATACSVPVTTDDGSTQYFAVVDDGAGAPEAITFDAIDATEQAAEVATIEATEGPVISVEVDQTVTATAGSNTNEPLYAGTAPFTPAHRQTGIDQATFPQAWANVPSEGAGVIVAVVDSGVQASHPDLAGAVVAGTDFIAAGDGTNDQYGHGTHVAGILAARDQDVGGIGAAPMVTILPIRVLGADGAGTYSGLINGINEAVARGARVISLSMGGTSLSPMLEQAVARATAAGVVVVAAAGNDGNCGAHYPASYAGVISVGATGQSTDALASFSQRGPTVDIAASGTNVWSTYPGSRYQTLSGTSMATPLVSAAAALVLAKCPGYGPAQVEARLEATAQPIPGNPIQSSPMSGALRAGAATLAPC